VETEITIGAGELILKIVIFFIFLTTVSCHAKVIDNSDYDLQSATEIVSNARNSLQDIVDYAKSRIDIFPANRAEKKQFLNREQREVVWHIWQTFMDRLMVLDEVGKEFETIYKNTDKMQKQQAFQVSYAAFLARYHYAMKFIDFLEHYPAMHTLLNQKVPELGMQKNLYKKVKFHYLNAFRGAEFVRLNTLYNFYGEDTRRKLVKGMNEDIKFIWRAGRGVGTKQTLKNALRIIQDTGFTIWFPVQKEVSEWMGDVKVSRTHRSLISHQQIKQIHALLEPGDIMLERREWYLSNIGLPGYWPHAALYIGTPKERKAYFNAEDISQNFLDSNLGLEEYLSNRYPEAYNKALAKQAGGHIPRIVEAISEGVSFTTVEHSIEADSVVILRPRLSKLEKAIAIKRAFHYSGRPYDFNFDFLTDSKLVCTELIYKAYEPSSSYAGIKFPLRELIGRQVTTANDMAEMFDQNYGTPEQQMDFITFYDGHERENKAIVSGLAVFRSSWKRPKWFIWVQDTLLESNLWK
jgi:hypothetical protein